MTRREIVGAYRRLSAEDQSAFNRWLVANTVVGAAAILGLIALTSIYPGKDQSSVTAQENPASVTAEAQ